ncbi:AsmA family protein [Photobacterium sp. DA100]|uniref:AsmA family protein n=1 Tax=Photobacterium sp. DA100 TaxID=3027472 RepID=UPI00247A8F89|nr:AsmA family protein [Photobacterium sp. DA100]WEM42187.1 AsmA family protein [Photobacterium sp. DA100]
MLEASMRFIGKIIATLIVLIALGVTIVLALLHTPYAAPMLSQAVNRLTPYTLSLADLRYHIRDPWHLTVNRPVLTLSDGQPPITANRLSLWLNPASLTQFTWQFDSLLIDEPVAHALQLDSLRLPEIYSRRLAISRLSVGTSPITLQQGELQLDNWHYQPNDPAPWWQQFDGNFQLAADDVQWQQWQARQLLLDGSHSDTKWKLNGFSLDWQHASINGQLDIATDQKTLDIQQITLSGLQLQDRGLTQTLQHQLEHWASLQWQATLHRVDILDSSIELPTISLNHANLSLTDWHWPGSAYSQQKAWLSFNAESGSWRQQSFTDPLLDLSFTPNAVILNGASVNALEGYWRVEGKVSPGTLQLDNLTSKGIKWFLPADWASHLSQALSPFKQIDIRSLDIGYAQLTAADSDIPWYINGLNLSGSDLILHPQPLFRLWHGNITATARQMSLNTVDLYEPLIDMASEQGLWQLKQAFLPFKDGLLEATGQLNLSQEGQPWQAALQGDSLPANILPQWLSVPWPASGRIDITAALQGLGQNYTSLAHSLNGELRATFRDSAVEQGGRSLFDAWLETSLSETPPLAKTAETDKPTPLAITPLQITSDRGRMTIAPLSITGQEIDAVLKGQWDLANPAGQWLELEAKLGCQHLIRRWQDGQQTVSGSLCDGKSI